jgi:LmbE family N-acetylglucosaminyl deacetylase
MMAEAALAPDVRPPWASIGSDAPNLALLRVRLVVVAPHPDDEVLGSGGLIAAHRRRGWPVIVLAVSDGEAAYGPGDRPLARRLAIRRRAEQRAALAELGVDHRSVHRLGLADSALERHESVITRWLIEHGSRHDVIVAPWEHDWHPDHEACGRASARAASQLGALRLATVFWARHRRWDRGVPTPAREALVAVSLTDADMRRRRSAMEAHRSQLVGPAGATPVVEPALLAHLDEPHELYVGPGR